MDNSSAENNDDRIIVEAVSARSLREHQARRLFDLKIGDALGCATFDQYLDAVGMDSLEPIPQVPVFPPEQVRLFGAQGIVLVDGRVLEKIGLVEYCKIVGLAYFGKDDTFTPFEEARAASGVRWMISQDGYRNRDRKPCDCRVTFAPFEVGGDVVEGVAIYLQDPMVISGHYMDFPGSVNRGSDGDWGTYFGIEGVPECVAYLGILDEDGPKLYWSVRDAHPYFGSVSRASIRASSV